MKIANDLRLLARAAHRLDEIELPAMQPGSSIMPGKVNPVIPEAVNMVAAQVIGNDAAIAVAGYERQPRAQRDDAGDRLRLLESIELARQRLHRACRQVRARHRRQRRALPRVRRADGGAGHGDRPGHRLRRGGEDLRGGRWPRTNRSARRSWMRVFSRRNGSTRFSTF